MRRETRRWNAATAQCWPGRGPRRSRVSRWHGHDVAGYAEARTGRTLATSGTAPQRDDLDAAAVGRAVLARHVSPKHRPASIVDRAGHDHAVARHVRVPAARGRRRGLDGI